MRFSGSRLDALSIRFADPLRDVQKESIRSNLSERKKSMNSN